MPPGRAATSPWLPCVPADGRGLPDRGGRWTGGGPAAGLVRGAGTSTSSSAYQALVQTAPCCLMVLAANLQA